MCQIVTFHKISYLLFVSNAKLNVLIKKILSYFCYKKNSNKENLY